MIAYLESDELPEGMVLASRYLTAYEWNENLNQIGTQGAPERKEETPLSPWRWHAGNEFTHNSDYLWEMKIDVR